MTETSHGAIGPALGYYYQAIYALILLFDSKQSDAFVSIESLDDVVLIDGKKKELYQLKHSINKDTILTIKSEQLWKTLKVWCDFLLTNDSNNGIFTLSTVASIKSDSPLNVLNDFEQSRVDLEVELLEEAKRVCSERDEVKEANKVKLALGQEGKELPYAIKYKGCEAFLNLSERSRKGLLKNMRLSSSSFSIEEAMEQVIGRIKKNTKKEHHTSLAKSILAWWDREALESLTRERKECIYLDELQEFISKKNAELYNDGFTDDLLDLELPPINSEHPIQKLQLSLIEASKSQIARSYDTEIKARIQRQKWMNDNLPAASKLLRYDQLLIKEWSYKFDETVERKWDFTTEQLKEKGRLLLDWSHENAHLQVSSISRYYNNPDLIRGSYQILSRTKDVGWHCEFNSLINLETDD
jgi:hypothetical protein